jgi:hypothetical protein
LVSTGSYHARGSEKDEWGHFDVQFYAWAGYAMTGFAITLPQAALAQPTVATDSAVYVERSQPGNMRSLEPADRLSRGDRVVTVVSWYRMGGNGGFTITNPLPRAIAYEASARDNQEVSVDGGRTWGRLGELRIGNRLATPEDVTHMRWRIPAVSAARGQGRIAYSGIVR